MDNTETLHNQKWSLQKPLASESKQTSSNQYRWSLVLVVMDNIQTFHYKRMVTAETVGFRFEQDLFLVPIIIGFGSHAQILKRFTTRTWLLQSTLASGSKQTSSNHYRLSYAFVVMHNIETFHNEKMVVAETVGFRFKADFINSVQMITGFCCHGQQRNVSTWLPQKPLVWDSKQTFSIQDNSS